MLSFVRKCDEILNYVCSAVIVSKKLYNRLKYIEVIEDFI